MGTPSEKKSQGVIAVHVDYMEIDVVVVFDQMETDAAVVVVEHKVMAVVFVEYKVVVVVVGRTLKTKKGL